jgi:hypothetical protein
VDIALTHLLFFSSSGRIAEFVSSDSPFKLQYNLVRLAENPIFRETRQFALEMGLIIAEFEKIKGHDPGTTFWTLVQDFKSTVLRYRYGRLVPESLLDGIKSNDEAWELYMQERDLIEDGPQSMFDLRLPRHQLEMRSCLEQKPLMNRRETLGTSMTELTALVKETVGTPQSVIFIDWIHLRSGFQVVGYDATSERLCIFGHVISPSVEEVQEWVSEHIGVRGELLEYNLDSPDILQKLHDLVEPIHRNCSPGRFAHILAVSQP